MPSPLHSTLPALNSSTKAARFRSKGGKRKRLARSLGWCDAIIILLDRLSEWGGSQTEAILGRASDCRVLRARSVTQPKRALSFTLLFRSIKPWLYPQQRLKDAVAIACITTCRNAAHFHHSPSLSLPLSLPSHLAPSPSCFLLPPSATSFPEARRAFISICQNVRLQQQEEDEMERLLGWRRERRVRHNRPSPSSQFRLSSYVRVFVIYDNMHEKIPLALASERQSLGNCFSEER